jgi:hypothetical protein
VAVARSHVPAARRPGWPPPTSPDARRLDPAPVPAPRSDIRGALTMTPCDLFGQLQGRTLWIIGDSMSKDLIKVGVGVGVGVGWGGVGWGGVGWGGVGWGGVGWGGVGGGGGGAGGVGRGAAASGRPRSAPAWPTPPKPALHACPRLSPPTTPNPRAQAFKCFMIEFWDLSQYHLTNNFTAMHHLQSIPGYGEPNCIHMAGNTRMCQVRGGARAGAGGRAGDGGGPRLGPRPAGPPPPRLAPWPPTTPPCPPITPHPTHPTPTPPQIHAIQGDLFVNTSRAASGVLPLITSSGLALKDDVIVLNFGLWHGDVQRPRYIQHLHELGEFYSAHKAAFPNMFFMETPKQHFADAADGDYQSKWLTDPKKKKGPHRCGPIANVTYTPSGALRAAPGDAVAAGVAGGTWRNVDARRILRDKYGMRLVPIYNTTVAFWKMHRSNFAGTECSHFCHPSIPQLWLWVLHRTLAQAGIKAVPAAAPTGPHVRHGCATVFERDQTKLGLPKPVEKVYAEAEARRVRELQQRHGPLWRLAHWFGRRRRR